VEYFSSIMTPRQLKVQSRFSSSSGNATRMFFNDSVSILIVCGVSLGYPEAHKARIRGQFEHLSNDQTIQFIDEHIDLETKQWMAFGHLSPKTGTPQLVVGNIQRAFQDYDRYSLAPSDETYYI